MTLSHGSCLAALLAAFSLGSCAKTAAPVAPAPARAAPARPDDVVVVVSTASLRRSASGLRSLVDAVQPGISAALGDPVLDGGLAQIVGAPSLDGLDLDGAVHLVILDAPIQAAVLAARIADPARLERATAGAHVDRADGWALIGREDAVRAAAPWIRAAIIPPPAPPDVTATVFIDTVRTHHQTQIQAMDQALEALARTSSTQAQIREVTMAMVNGVLESERLVATARASARGAELEFTLVPRAGSKLATFAVAQRPSDYRLIEKLPAGAEVDILMAGRLAAGPYRDALAAMTGQMMGLTAAPMQSTLRQIGALFDGEFASGGTFPSAGGMTGVQIYAVQDGAALDKAIEKLLTQVSSGVAYTYNNIQMTLTGLPELSRYRDVPVRGWKTTMDFETVPEAQRPMMKALYGPDGITSRAAVVDRSAVVAIGSAEGLFEAIDAVRGGGKRFSPTPAQAALLAESRRRGESIVCLIDLVQTWTRLVSLATATPGAPRSPSPASRGAAMAMGFGASDRALRMRFAVPSETLRQIMAMAASLRGVP